MAGYDLFLGQLFEHEDEPLVTPFEQWCDEHGTHPEAPGACEAWAADRAPQRLDHRVAS